MGAKISCLLTLTSYIEKYTALEAVWKTGNEASSKHSELYERGQSDEQNCCNGREL